ncbi:hypothetical protein E4T52_16046 [Aureobasidium sp. EXF-3400]|nr:hypothetical protein E4T51_15287 [Aureobasidium sp. EXF-12344]KAI4768882.1 hypothetical protein E4T52_16046 [Aureobasidium sp. EXF-3400]
MLYSTIFFAASVGLAAAQVQTGNYTIDPNSVDSTTRANWCRAETNTCPVLCGGNLYKSNTCTQASTNSSTLPIISDLTYTCVCNNGVSPDMSLYQNTIPSFVCQEYKGQCLATNAGNATAQDQCQKISCGNQTASNIISSSASATSSSASSSGSGTVASATSAVASGASSAASSASSAASTGAATAVTVGNGALLASLFGLFAYAL